MIDEVLAVQQFAEAHTRIRDKARNGHAASDDRDDEKKKKKPEDEPRFGEKDAHRTDFYR